MLLPVLIKSPGQEKFIAGSADHIILEDEVMKVKL
jgi:hypothetical protein